MQYEQPKGTDAELCIAAAVSALDASDCPAYLQPVLAPLLLPQLAVKNEELVDPRHPSCRLPHRVVRVIDPATGNVRHHGVRSADPLTVRELVVREHNACTHAERTRRASASPDWMSFRWSERDI